MSDVDREFLQGTFDVCPFHRHMHLELAVIEKGKVDVWARYHPDLDQGMGILHGGVFAAAHDTATYYAALSHYGASGRFPLTHEYKLNLLASAKREDIRASAVLIKAGRTIAVAEAKIYTASGKLVAAGMSSFVIPQP